ncbi:MAG: hypothetical protein E7321_08920 [Clostridiales bacterium]|nr:hypothetical protein [Clostridiales bacterium]
MQMRTKFDEIQGIPGKSAYEIAVENGFEGTEQEWLESLGGSVSDEQIEKAVNKYLDENPIGIPDVTTADNGKVLTVVGGKWAAAELPKYDGEYEITPHAEESTTLLTAQKFMDSNVKVNKVPYFETSNQADGETVYIATEVDIYGD